MSQPADLESMEHVLITGGKGVKNFKVRVQHQRLEEERNKVRRNEITALAAFYMVAASSFVWVPYLVAPFTGVKLIASIAGVILSTILLWFATYVGTKRGWKETLVISTGVLAGLVTLLLSRFTTSAFIVRYVFSSFFIAVFVAGFNYVLYFNNLSSGGKTNAKLLHARYLEYGRSAFWLFLLMFTGYITWEFTVLGRVDVETGSTWRAGVLGLLQVVSVFGIGGLALFVAFDRKLRQIERLTKEG